MVQLDEILPDMNENQDADREHELNPTEEEAVVQPGTEIFIFSDIEC